MCWQFNIFFNFVPERLCIVIISNLMPHWSEINTNNSCYIRVKPIFFNSKRHFLMDFLQTSVIFFKVAPQKLFKKMDLVNHLATFMYAFDDFFSFVKHLKLFYSYCSIFSCRLFKKMHKLSKNDEEWPAFYLIKIMMIFIYTLFNEGGCLCWRNIIPNSALRVACCFLGHWQMRWKLGCN